MRPGRILWASLSISLVITGCSAPRPQPADSAASEKWLTCDECIANERVDLVSRGDIVVPLMREALLFYPPVGEEARVRRQAANAHAMLAPVGVTLDDFVRQQFHNYVARRQTRAALALADINTAAARSALMKADSAPIIVQYRPDVARTIRFLNSARRAAPYTGTVANRSPSFGDSVEVLAKPATAFTPSAIAAMDSSPFPASSLLYIREPNRLVFAAVGTAGSHSVAVIDSGVSPDAFLFDIGIVSQADRNDRHTRTCVNLACMRDSAEAINPAALPFLAFQSLSSAGARLDTIDVFKITTAGSVSLTARLDWASPGPPVNLDLTWRSCTTLGPVGNMAGATASRPEATSVTIPSGQCWLLLVTGPSTPGVASVFARLRVTLP